MRRTFNPYNYNFPQYTMQNDQRFIGPIFPFLGGAIIGYIAGRPQYNYSAPAYYPLYYPYYSYPYQSYSNQPYSNN